MSNEQTKHVNELSFSDEELAFLNNLLRQSEVKLTSEQALLIAMSRIPMPMQMQLTLKIGTAWEARQQELNSPKIPSQPIPDEAFDSNPESSEKN